MNKDFILLTLKNNFLDLVNIILLVNLAKALIFCVKFTVNIKKITNNKSKTTSKKKIQWKHYIKHGVNK